MAPSSRAWFVNGAHCHSTFDFFRSIFSLRFGASGGWSALKVPWSRTTWPPASLEAILCGGGVCALETWRVACMRCAEGNAGVASVNETSALAQQGL